MGYVILNIKGFRNVQWLIISESKIVVRYVSISFAPILARQTFDLRNMRRLEYLPEQSQFLSCNSAWILFSAYFKFGAENKFTQQQSRHDSIIFQQILFLYIGDVAVPMGETYIHEVSFIFGTRRQRLCCRLLAPRFHILFFFCFWRIHNVYIYTVLSPVYIYIIYICI